MPYRRLPNTDQARLRSLRHAVSKADTVRLYELAFSQKTLVKIQGFLPIFERSMFEYKQVIEKQGKQGVAYRELLKNARMYVSHFIQVLNLSVIRAEIKTSDQELYGLAADTRSLPDLSTDHLVFEWGQKVIDGEKKRIMHGGTPIYTPSIAKVQVSYERFKESYIKQKYTNNSLERHQTIIAEMREKADKLIAELWNQVEKSFEQEPNSDSKIERCRDYGIIYYYRKEEKQNAS